MLDYSWDESIRNKSGLFDFHQLFSNHQPAKSGTCTMRKSSRLILISFALSFLSSVDVLAEDIVYVNDVLYVPLRSGQGNEYRIINKGLRSGSKLTRIERSEDDTWSKVRTEAGVEGWIPNQYISEEETAQIILDRTLATLAKTEKELQTLKQQYAALKKEKDNIHSDANTSQSQVAKLSQELDKIKQISANAIELDKRYRELLEKHELTQTQRDSLKAENENLKEDKTLSFMFYGAGILILGMILAIVIPTLKPKKRYSDWA